MDHPQQVGFGPEADLVRVAPSLLALPAERSALRRCHRWRSHRWRLARRTLRRRTLRRKIRAQPVRGLVVPFGYYDDWYSGYGYYDPSTVTPDEQPTYPTTAYTYVKPRSSCSTQTYKVPSEDGGEASINVVRC
jgi:hypothetical protein